MSHIQPESISIQLEQKTSSSIIRTTSMNGSNPGRDKWLALFLAYTEGGDVSAARQIQDKLFEIARNVGQAQFSHSHEAETPEDIARSAFDNMVKRYGGWSEEDFIRNGRSNFLGLMVGVVKNGFRNLRQFRKKVSLFISDAGLEKLAIEGIPERILQKLAEFTNRKYSSEKALLQMIDGVLANEAEQLVYRKIILDVLRSAPVEPANRQPLRLQYENIELPDTAPGPGNSLEREDIRQAIRSCHVSLRQADELKWLVYSIWLQVKQFQIDMDVQLYVDLRELAAVSRETEQIMMILRAIGEKQPPELQLSPKTLTKIRGGLSSQNVRVIIDRAKKLVAQCLRNKGITPAN